MPIFYQDSSIVIVNSSCLLMKELPDEVVQCVVTSPPYWGLRKYAGLPDLIWGGDPDCGHKWILTTELINKGHDGKVAATSGIGATKVTGFCSLCGAWKGQLGLEPSPELYISHLIEMFCEVRRVLRKDGVVFLNIGDSYASQGGAVKHSIYETMGGTIPKGYEQSRHINHKTIKPKDLCLIPFRLTIALQEDGWWVRSVIIWNKPNPMPESVKDRPTESHEYILMLTKSAHYYYDQEAVREPHESDLITKRTWGHKHDERLNNRSERSTNAGILNPSGRNLRSVWTFPTQPYPEAHFATYPEKLVEICVKAATPEVGCCSKCGKPWVRIVERKVNTEKPSRIYTADTPGITQGVGSYTLGQTEYLETHTLGWKPQCKCQNADKIPSIVLDPFAGSGTTLAVAKFLGRRAVGYELSTEYCELAKNRKTKQERAEEKKKN